MTETDFLDQPPDDATLTAYDRAHLKLYLRLLDAETEGAHWHEVVEHLFGISPKADPERAARVHITHLSRAKWIAGSGYSELFLQRPN